MLQIYNEINVFYFCEETHQLADHQGLINLHTRLNQEAEKLSKWKTSTELGLRQKVSDIIIKN